MSEQIPAPAIDGTTVHTRATNYTVTCLPDDPIDPGAFDIVVEFAGGVSPDGQRPEDQQWMVRRRNHWRVLCAETDPPFFTSALQSPAMCLSREGEWDEDRRDDAWLAAHRFDLETALRVAAGQAPLVKVGGMTPAELLAWRAER